MCYIHTEPYVLFSYAQDLPFATDKKTPAKELAKLIRDLNNMPTLSLELEIPPEMKRSNSAGSGDGRQRRSLDANSVDDVLMNECNREDDDCDDDDDGVDELTQQLELFESSLKDYDSLVTSLCQSDVDGNSNS